jgi:Predicted membrane protein (DUF2142)
VGAGPTRKGLRHFWPRSFLLVLALTILWTLATPLFAAPDEPAHVLKAVAAGRGELSGPPVAGEPAAVMDVTVPAGYATIGEVPSCFYRSRDEPAGCAKKPVYQAGVVKTPTYVGHYPAFYYLLVGWPSRIIQSPGKAVYAMRLVSDVVSSVLVSLALALVLTDRRKAPLPLLGLGIAVTPQALFLASVVNPAGLAISAALCLWTAGLILMRPNDEVPGTDESEGELGTQPVLQAEGRLLEPHGVSRRALLFIVAASGLVEAFSVALGPLWVALTVVVLVACASGMKGRQLLYQRDARLTAAGLVVGVGAATVLVWANGSLAVLPSSRTVRTGTPWLTVIARSASYVPDYVAQAVGAMGWLETRPPLLTYLIWGTLLVILAIAVFRFASRQMRVVLSAFAAVAVLAPILISASQALHLGSIVWEGKDGMPLWVGLPLVAASASAAWWSKHRQTSRLLLGAAGVGQFAAFLGALHRYTVGVHGPWSMWSTVADGWSPPLPPLVLLGLYALALVLLWGFLLYRPAGGQTIRHRPTAAPT